MFENYFSNTTASAIRCDTINMNEINEIAKNYEEAANPQEKVSKDTKCKIEYMNGGIYMREYPGYPSNVSSTPKFIVPDIEDVAVIRDNYDKARVVVVMFVDGTETRATLSGCDSFSLEQGISVCITKKILNLVTSSKNGSAMYNKIIRHAVQVMQDNEKEREMAEAELKRAERKHAKAMEKKRKRDERRAAAVREHVIEIQKEAFIRAIREIREMQENDA